MTGSSQSSNDKISHRIFQQPLNIAWYADASKTSRSSFTQQMLNRTYHPIFLLRKYNCRIPSFPLCSYVKDVASRRLDRSCHDSQNRSKRPLLNVSMDRESQVFMGCSNLNLDFIRLPRFRLKTFGPEGAQSIREVPPYCDELQKSIGRHNSGRGRSFRDPNGPFRRQVVNARDFRNCVLVIAGGPELEPGTPHPTQSSRMGPFGRVYLIPIAAFGAVLDHHAV